MNSLAAQGLPETSEAQQTFIFSEVMTQMLNNHCRFCLEIKLKAKRNKCRMI